MALPKEQTRNYKVFMACLDRKAEYQRHKESIKKRVREWRKANPERVREYARERARTPEQLAKRRIRSREWNANNKERCLYSMARKRARNSGLEFTIDVEDIVIPDRCPLLGIPIVRDARMSVRQGSASLDRIDTTKGYIKGNVWVISWEANKMKSCASLDSLVTFARNVLKHFDDR